MKKALEHLPYINSVGLVLLTVGINFLSNIHMLSLEQVSKSQILLDAAIFGVVTALIDTFAVWYLLKKMYQEGKLPADPVRDERMNLLPGNPVLLAAVMAIIFAGLAYLFNLFVLVFFAKEALLPYGFMVWKLFYAVIFSAYMVKILIYRYAQPGVFGNAEQHGTDQLQEIFPPVSTFKEQWDAMVSDFGFNMITGLLLGGTVINADHSLTVYGASREGIVISALIYAVIVMVMMVYPVIKKVYETVISGEIAIPVTKPNILASFPTSPLGNALVIFIPVAVLSATFLWAMFEIFNFEKLNFFQFFVLRLMLINLLTVLTVKYATARYSQRIG